MNPAVPEAAPPPSPGYLGLNTLLYYDYAPTATAVRPPPAPGKLRILWVTSLRDIGAEDLNGARVAVPEGEFYMMGLLEALVRRLNGEALLHHFLSPDLVKVYEQADPDELYHGAAVRSFDWLKAMLMLQVIDGDAFFANRVELAGVVIDDTARDLARGRLGKYGLMPGGGRHWIVPDDLAARQNGDRLPLAKLVRHVPSNYRHLPLKDPGRPAAKAEFEAAIAARFRETGANLLVFDHAMFIADNLIRGHGLQRFILNIHPAIVEPNHPNAFFGCTPTANALDCARTSARPVTTGATLHFVDEGIDTGPRLLVGNLTNVYAEDHAVQLRLRNYSAKLLVFFLGLKHYAENVRSYFGAPGLTLADLRSTRRRVTLEELLASTHET